MKKVRTLVLCNCRNSFLSPCLLGPVDQFKLHVLYRYLFQLECNCFTVKDEHLHVCIIIIFIAENKF